MMIPHPQDRHNLLRHFQIKQVPFNLKSPIFPLAGGFFPFEHHCSSPISWNKLLRTLLHIYKFIFSFSYVLIIFSVPLEVLRSFQLFKTLVRAPVLSADLKSAFGVVKKHHRTEAPTWRFLFVICRKKEENPKQIKKNRIKRSLLEQLLCWKRY